MSTKQLYGALSRLHRLQQDPPPHAISPLSRQSTASSLCQHSSHARTHHPSALKMALKPFPVLGSREPRAPSPEHKGKSGAASVCKLIIKCFPPAEFLPIQHHGNSFIPLLGSSVATETVSMTHPQERRANQNQRKGENPKQNPHRAPAHHCLHPCISFADRKYSKTLIYFDRCTPI